MRALVPSVHWQATVVLQLVFHTFPPGSQWQQLVYQQPNVVLCPHGAGQRCPNFPVSSPILWTGLSCTGLLSYPLIIIHITISPGIILLGSTEQNLQAHLSVQLSDRFPHALISIRSRVSVSESMCFPCCFSLTASCGLP